MGVNTESFSAEFTQPANTTRGAESRVIPSSSSWGSLAPVVWKLRQFLQYWEHGFGPQKILTTQEVLKMYIYISLDRYLYICMYIYKSISINHYLNSRASVSQHSPQARRIALKGKKLFPCRKKEEICGASQLPVFTWQNTQNFCVSFLLIFCTILCTYHMYNHRIFWVERHSQGSLSPTLNCITDNELTEVCT